MVFFDYVYYRICMFYDKYEKAAETSGLLVLTLMYAFNIFSISSIFEIILRRKFNPGKLSIVVFLATLLVLNGMRYNKIDFASLKEKWKDENTFTRIRRGRGVLVYIIISTIICIGLAIYLGSKKW